MKLHENKTKQFEEEKKIDRNNLWQKEMFIAFFYYLSHKASRKEAIALRLYYYLALISIFFY